MYFCLKRRSAKNDTLRNYRSKPEQVHTRDSYLRCATTSLNLRKVSLSLIASTSSLNDTNCVDLIEQRLRTSFTRSSHVQTRVFFKICINPYLVRSVTCGVELRADDGRLLYPELEYSVRKVKTSFEISYSEPNREVVEHLRSSITYCITFEFDRDKDSTCSLKTLHKMFCQ